MIRLQKEYDKRKSRIRLKQIEAKSSLKKKKFRIFRERTKCENEAKWSQKKMFTKNEKFTRNNFLISLETLGSWRPLHPLPLIQSIATFFI